MATPRYLITSSLKPDLPVSPDDFILAIFYFNDKNNSFDCGVQNSDPRFFEIFAYVLLSDKQKAKTKHSLFRELARVVNQALFWRLVNLSLKNRNGFVVGLRTVSKKEAHDSRHNNCNELHLTSLRRFGLDNLQLRSGWIISVTAFVPVNRSPILRPGIKSFPVKSNWSVTTTTSGALRYKHKSSCLVGGEGVQPPYGGELSSPPR